MEDQPALASPPSAAYRFRKFAQRHRGAVTGGFAVAAALVIGVITTIWQAQAARHEREIAVQERRAAVEQRQEAEKQRSRAETEAKRAGSARILVK